MKNLKNGFMLTGNNDFEVNSVQINDPAQFADSLGVRPTVIKKSVNDDMKGDIRKKQMKSPVTKS